MKADIRPCPHEALQYVGGAPFPKWIAEHSERCFVFDGQWYMVVRITE